MFQVQCLQTTEKTETELYSKYYIGPFINGQSTTIGNTLRRILLSSLQGLAIVGVRITNINHEFSTIPNVKEDVIDILLNLKQIVFICERACQEACNKLSKSRFYYFLVKINVNEFATIC